MEKKFKYVKCFQNKYRFVGSGTWLECREFIANEFGIYRQWIIKLKEHIGIKSNHFDVKLLFLKDI